MTPKDQVRQHLIDNPAMNRSIIGDTEKDKYGREIRGGKYIAAVAVRTPVGIVTALIEFDSHENVAMLILGVLEGADCGDINGTVTRFLDIEKTVTASMLEDVKTKGLARNKREVDFNRKQARAPDLLSAD